MKLIRRANLATPARGSTRFRSRARERGQVVVLFAGAVFALVALCAVVVDVAWYWTNNLRMQRAADAAALAGVVWLPSKPQTAYNVARAEAAKNGYTDGAGGVTITPVVDASNKQRLKVTITGPVGTFFARAVGINTFAAKRDAKADYVLPVPMGSPQNYYGVGFFEGLVPQTSTTNAAGASSCGTAAWSSSCTGNIPTIAPSGGQWTASSGAILASVQTNNNIYATENTNGQMQQWSTFGLLSGGSAIPSPGANQVLSITGIRSACRTRPCPRPAANSTIGVDLSWDGGGTWSTAVMTPSLGTNTSTGDYTLGSNSATSAWGSRTWGRNDFSDTNFRVRLTANKGCATAGTTLRVDMMEARVSWNVETTTTTWNQQTLSVPDPVSGTLASQGFWGAIFTSGGVRQNGDKYAPSYIGGGITGVSSSSSSPTYDSAGYDYTIELPGTRRPALIGPGPAVRPDLLRNRHNGHGGSFGAGDHWTTHGSSGCHGGGPCQLSRTASTTRRARSST